MCNNICHHKGYIIYYYYHVIVLQIKSHIILFLTTYVFYPFFDCPVNEKYICVEQLLDLTRFQHGLFLFGYLIGRFDRVLGRFHNVPSSHLQWRERFVSFLFVEFDIVDDILFCDFEEVVWFVSWFVVVGMWSKSTVSLLWVSKIFETVWTTSVVHSKIIAKGFSNACDGCAM